MEALLNHFLKTPHNELYQVSRLFTDTQNLKEQFRINNRTIFVCLWSAQNLSKKDISQI